MITSKVLDFHCQDYKSLLVKLNLYKNIKVGVYKLHFRFPQVLQCRENNFTSPGIFTYQD